MQVLYENNHLIAVFKPAGLLVQGDKHGEECLIDQVKVYLKEKYQKPGNVFLGLLHRLDRPVAGIVLFAKTSKGASRLSQQFREHHVKKIYHTLVEVTSRATLSPRGTLVNYIKKDPQINKVEVFDEEVPGALRAELSYEILERRENQALIEIELKTGRPHQIRAQFAHLGCPVLGDKKYGSTDVQNDKSIALCAVRIEFNHPIQSSKRIEVSIPSPFYNRS